MVTANIIIEIVSQELKKNYILITHYSLKKLMTIEGQNDKNKMKKDRSIIDLERNN